MITRETAPFRQFDLGSPIYSSLSLVFMKPQVSWPSILAKLIAKQDLERSEANWAMSQIMAGDSSEAEIAAFMLALRSKGETVSELAGLVDVMLKQAVLLDTGNDALDIVGTGGDLVGTVNVSSMASILASAAGVPVLKHGSKSASGKTGSSEMLEVLGIKLDLSPQRVAEVFRETGITFFFAPVFHPAMRHVAPIRKQLGVPTTFNFLGPLANPAQPIATSLGVANPQIAPLMAQELAERGRFGLVSRGNDGLDELTTTTTSSIWMVTPEGVQQQQLNPSDFGIKTATQDALLGGDAQQNAQVATDLFAGNTKNQLGAVRDIVILNAAGGVVAYRVAKSPQLSGSSVKTLFESAIEQVTSALDSGAGANKLEQWVSATQK
jgi:anthranilate phosphoribosyltransferase